MSVLKEKFRGEFESCTIVFFGKSSEEIYTKVSDRFGYSKFYLIDEDGVIEGGYDGSFGWGGIYGLTEEDFQLYNAHEHLSKEIENGYEPMCVVYGYPTELACDNNYDYIYVDENGDIIDIDDYPRGVFDGVLVQARRLKNKSVEKPLKLEFGKRYVRRDGEISGVLEDTFTSSYPFLDESQSATYTENGIRISGTSDPSDLISEYVDDPQISRKGYRDHFRNWYEGISGEELVDEDGVLYGAFCQMVSITKKS